MCFIDILFSLSLTIFPTSFLVFMQLYFQFEQDFALGSIKLKALIDLFEEIVEEPFFNQLRWQPVAQFRIFDFWYLLMTIDPFFSYSPAIDIPCQIIPLRMRIPIFSVQNELVLAFMWGRYSNCWYLLNSICCKLAQTIGYWLLDNKVVLVCHESFYCYRIVVSPIKQV